MDSDRPDAGSPATAVGARQDPPHGIHQVVDTWSPYSALSGRGRRLIAHAWGRLGFGRELAVLARYELEMMVLRAWCAVSPAHRRQVRALRRRTHLKVHVGCGNSLRPEWINLDCFPPRPRPGCEILVLDMRRGLPFADASAEAIYSEHFFEHVPVATTRGVLFPECFRILAPGGSIRIGVPDGELWVDAYLEQRTTGVASPFLIGQPTPMMALNEIARGFSHAFLWDFETLRHALAEAGFVDLRKARSGDTGLPVFGSMDQTEPWRVAQTVYIEGRRP